MQILAGALKCTRHASFLALPRAPRPLSCRAQSAIQAALLHDVVDDTSTTLADIHGEFGVEVATMVHKISQLSTMNQLLRRRRRQMVRPE